MSTYMSRRIRRQTRTTHARLKVAVLVALGFNVLALLGQVML